MLASIGGSVGAAGDGVMLGCWGTAGDGVMLGCWGAAGDVMVGYWGMV